MKSKVILAIATICLSLAGTVSANQVIHPSNNVTQTPVIHWVSHPGRGDGVEVHIDSHRYNVIITADRQYHGENTCRVDVIGCSSTAALQPGDISLCEPTSEAVFISAQCGDQGGVAAGTVRYIKK